MIPIVLIFLTILLVAFVFLALGIWIGRLTPRRNRGTDVIDFTGGRGEPLLPKARNIRRIW